MGRFDVTMNKDRCLNFFLLQLVTSGVSSYQHTSVTLEFFETVVRYEKFFTVEPQHIPCVLVSIYLGGGVPCISANNQYFIFITFLEPKVLRNP